MSGLVLVIGGSGQLALALKLLGRIAGRPVEAVGRPEADLANMATLERLIASRAPAIVINAAAYTAVDKAESEPDAAMTLNAEGPAALARLAHIHGIPLVHISTDYVFDGTGSRPYREEDPIKPLGAYGLSKAMGEAKIRNALDRHLILRTAWLYSADGTNFLRTMLKLGAERPVLRVVDDQRGSPTYAGELAQAVARVAEAALAPGFRGWGTYHVTNAGETTWHGFAAAIFALAAERGMRVPRLDRIATADYPTPARRPAYSVLDGSRARRVFGLDMPDWREALARCFVRLPAPENAA